MHSKMQHGMKLLQMRDLFGVGDDSVERVSMFYPWQYLSAKRP